jgi:hypothetical protein
MRLAQRGVSDQTGPEPSSPPSLPLVAVRGIELDRAEELQQVELAPALDIFLERCVDRFLLRAVAADLLRLSQEIVIDR